MTFRQRVDRYGSKAVKTVYNGHKYHSAFEAGIAAQQDIRQRAGEILSWERQYQVVCVPYRLNDDGTFTAVSKLAVRHKVDFRTRNLPTAPYAYTLIEAKGAETDDYLRRRDWLEQFWLPCHPDHDYLVIRDGRGNRAAWSAFATKIMPRKGLNR